MDLSRCRLTGLVVSVLCTGTAMAQAPVKDAISAHALAAHIRFLSHDRLEGRGVGSRADPLARLYLATQLAGAGCAPGAADGSFDQVVPILGITANVQAELTWSGKGEPFAWKAPDQYTAVAGHPDPTSEWKDAELAFVGYGIHAPEQQWDDFKGMDLKGKVLLVLNDDPAHDPNMFAGKARLYYGRWSYKYEEAARRGAVGAIVIHTTESAGYPFQVIQSNHGREAFWLPFRAGEPTLAIRSWCTEEAARTLFQRSGQDFDQQKATAQTREFRPVLLGLRATLSLQNSLREIQSGNVLARLEGSDPKLKDQAVVVTAHFDHLGLGPVKKDDGIYNGALDNASGCAALLEVARACGRLEPRPRRTILFAAVTAEESGLLGSEFLAKNLPMPKSQVIANFNIDGINIWGRTNDLEMIGHGKNSLTALAESVAKELGRTIKPDSEPNLGLFYRSDHFNFARIGVPAAYMKAGRDFVDNAEGKRRIKAMYTTVNYHQPSDEFDPRWDLSGAVADLELITTCLLRCANAEQGPTWTAGDEFEKLR